MNALQAEPVCERAVRNLAAAFYTRVRRDHVLAPVFARAVGTSDAAWAAHVALAGDSWSSIFLAGRRRAPGLSRLSLMEPALVERWMSLFAGTCTDLFEPEIAGVFLADKTRIAAGLSARRRSAMAAR